MISAIIMASGFSRRMGCNKLLIEFNGKTLVQNIIDKILECNFKDCVLVAQDEEVMEIGKKCGIKIVYNVNALNGQSESIKLGLVNLEVSKGYMFFTADQPFLSVSTINKLIIKFNENTNNIIIPICNNKRGNPVIFPKYLVSELLELEGDNGGRIIINRHKEKNMLVNILDEKELLDIDTKEELELAKF